MSREQSNKTAPSYDEKLAQLLEEAENCSEYQFIELNMNGISSLTVDKKLFQKGIDSVSEVCGAICALSNVGVSPESAMAFLASKYEIDTTYKMQIDLSDDINKTSIKVAELSGEAQLKQQI